jgi:ribulose-phosphate 3-epimerase
MHTEVSTSILGADFTNIEKLSESIKSSGADMIHFDVMDGNFVPNISFGAPILKALDKCSDMFMDVHLMIEDPLKYSPDFVKAGADLITFHYESKSDTAKTIEKIKSLGVMVGISVKPSTDVKEILKYASMVDLILVMTVEPGFGGQSFMEDMMEKVKILKEYKEENNLSYKIQVDGGINDKTGRISVDAGVDVLVAGSYILNADDMKKAVDSLHIK